MKMRLMAVLCLGPKHESIVEDRKEAAKKDEERENTFKPKLCKSKLAHMWASASRTELKGEKRCAHSHAYRNVF